MNIISVVKLLVLKYVLLAGNFFSNRSLNRAFNKFVNTDSAGHKYALFTFINVKINNSSLLQSKLINAPQCATPLPTAPYVSEFVKNLSGSPVE